MTFSNINAGYKLDHCSTHEDEGKPTLETVACCALSDLATCIYIVKYCVLFKDDYLQQLSLCPECLNGCTESLSRLYNKQRTSALDI